MIVGIVTENGTVLLDYVRELRSQSLPREEVLVRVGRARLRPVMMTTLTPTCTLFPLALGLGAGTQMQQLPAIAVIGGLALGTVFTLVVAPVVYSVFRRDDRHSRWGSTHGSPR